MKNKIAFFILCLVFVSSSFYRPPIVSTACQRITQTSGTVTYYTTAADIWLLFDNSSTIATITVPFPDNPGDGQSFGISARSDITALTLSTSSIPISGSITTLSGGNCVRWVYNQDGNRWFNYLKPTTWGVISGTLSNQSDLQSSFNGKISTSGDGSALTGLTKSQVGLGNVTNESKATMFTSPAFTGTPTGITASHVGLGNVTNESKATMFASPTFTGSTSGLTAGMVGLGNVTNESKATMFTSPAFTGTPTGLTSTHVGLGNVTNESKATMFTSPTFTGTVTTPAGMIGMPEYARITGSNVTTTGQTLVDITGLSRALVANAVYEFEAVMSATTSAVTTGISYGVQYSAAGATIEANIVAASSTTAAKAERISAFNTATTAFLATSAQAGGVRIQGIVTTGANPGNLTVRHLKITSGTSTILINSFLKVTRIQ